jgi:hypothetical protein
VGHNMNKNRPTNIKTDKFYIFKKHITYDLDNAYRTISKQR